MRSFSQYRENICFSECCANAVEPIVGSITYEPPVFEQALFTKSELGSVQFGDITRILLHSKDYVKKLGLAPVEDLLSQLNSSSPSESVPDSELFERIVPRYCQSPSEKVSFLKDLLSRLDSSTNSYKELKARYDSAVEALASKSVSKDKEKEE